jgi:hypothetical protein
MVVGYKIYIHTNTDQLERHKYKMKSIRKKYLYTKLQSCIYVYIQLYET